MHRSMGLVASILALSPIVASAEKAEAQVIYRCHLPGSAVEFSQTPCAPDAAIVELGATNRAAAPSEAMNEALRDQRARSEGSRETQSRSARSRASQQLACGRARDRLLNLEERWRALRRSGYTPRQERDQEQRIREAKRQVATVCQ